MFNETIPVRGHVQLVARDEQGNEVARYDQPNLVVNLGREALCKLVALADPDYQITTIKFGTSTAATSATDSAITGAYTKNVDGVNYPAQTKVRFLFSLAAGENNGMAINELGLFCDGGTMFARTVITTFNKTAGITLSGTWAIQF